MNKLILAALLLSVATSASAGFKYFGKKGEFMNSTETVQERNEREYQEALRMQQVNQFWQNRPDLPHPDQNRKVSQPQVQEEEQPASGNLRRPAPGGHQRHEFRDKYGFGTPASLYYNIREERKALQKERQAAEKRNAIQRSQTLKRVPIR